MRDHSSVHHIWVNARYGFSVGGSSAVERTDEEVRAETRAFLSGIDPATGYLAE